MSNLSIAARIIIDAIAKEDQALDWTQPLSSKFQKVAFSPCDVLDSNCLFKLRYNELVLCHINLGF